MSDNEYLNILRRKIIESRTKVSIAEWVCQNTTLDSGQKFSFKRHKFQEQILNDLCENLTVIKTAQVGLSEISIRKAIAFMALNPGVKLLYSYPDLNLLKANSQTRIAPIFERDFPVGKNDKQIRNMNIMQLGRSFMYIGANSESNATSLSLDFLIHDETDLSSVEFLALCASRLQHSQYKIKQDFSTPTFDNFGVSAGFDSSNQYHYLIKCPHCGKWTYPEYNTDFVVIPNLPTSVENLVEDINEEILYQLDLNNAYVKCDKCGGKLDLSDNAEREWVAKKPERVDYHGYRVNCFTSELLSIKYLANQIWQYKKKDQIRRAYNVLLGIAYHNSSTRLELKDILACMQDERLQNIPKDKPCFIGIDVGTSCSVVISTNETDIIHFEVVQFDKLIERYKELCNMYNIVAGIIDRHPQISLANDLRDISEGKVMPVVYTSGKSLEPKYDIYGKIDYYKIDRTGALDRLRDLVNTHKLTMSGYTTYKNTLLVHFRDNYRDDRIGEDGPPVWRKLTGEDHFFHASSYSLLAHKLYEYVNSIGDIETRTCVDLVGIDYSQKTLYNNDLLEYRSNSRGNFRRKRW